MRPAFVAIVLALFVQKPVWADQLFMPPETVFYCEMTNHRLMFAPIKLDGLTGTTTVLNLNRFKMKVSKAQGEVIFSGNTFRPMPLLKYLTDTDWTAHEPELSQAFAWFDDGAFAYSSLGEFEGKPALLIVLATCEEF